MNSLPARIREGMSGYGRRDNKISSGNHLDVTSMNCVFLWDHRGAFSAELMSMALGVGVIELFASATI